MTIPGPAQTVETAGVWRTLDASANRAAEAIRVLEDALRFMLGDAHLARLAKAIRHDLAVVLAAAEFAERIRLRDVAGDVGAGVAATRTPARATLADLLAANAARGTQALRSLEEFSRLVVPAATPVFEQLRYRLYTLERAAVTVVVSAERLADVRLCVLLAVGSSGKGFASQLNQLLAAGVGMIQLWDKAASVPLLCERTRAAVAAARRQAEASESPRCLVIVNDRADVAVAAGADGVHLGADDLPVPLARRVCGPRLLIGRTAHCLNEVQQAVLDGADYLGIGPCFPSATKGFASFAPAESWLSSSKISWPAF
ncbi:MAG: thiamine phosphate synthase [Planctomycetia bacterium]|nr:thiamine phosphate synthase [Planctomycetia bacterium]